MTSDQHEPQFRRRRNWQVREEDRGQARVQEPTAANPTIRKYKRRVVVTLKRKTKWSWAAETKSMS